MKTRFLLIITTLSFGLIISCNSDDDDNKQIEYDIGSVGPAGGNVFYDSGNYDNGWRYIETAPSDIEGFEWGCFNSPIENARNISIGTGLENSLAIVEFHNNFNDYYNNPSECSDVSNGTVAAKTCLELAINGFDNWHLPSEGEMLLMYEVLHLNGLGDFEENDKLYWSSTEHDDNTATATDFSNGDQGWNCKQCDFGFMKVRAVRYF
ncbi:hypothetical protein [Maribacter sp. IgM3_T14_3]|uniref:hypothetical protein n=1 Tax=Maribacter sp. IgM3_T14_3 TaxID=3415140 RepID=UPI003C703668